jgi:hypothetical protein
MSENYQGDSFEFEEVGEALSDETASAIDDDWYSDGYADAPETSEEPEEETSGETDEADQQNQEEAEDKQAEEAPAETNSTEPAKEEKAGEADEAADQRFVLKHLDQTHEVGKEEVIALAQKGLDYDRKTEKLNNKIAAYEEFLEELAGPNLSKDQFMDSVRARMLVAQEGKAGRQISETEALLRVQANRANKERQAAENAAAEQQRQKEAADQRVRDALNRFAAARSDVKASDIPQSVWEDFNKTLDMEASFAKYENAQYRAKITELEKKMEAMETSAKNSAHSTGSRKSAGNLSPDAAFDKLWYDGT